MPESVYKVIELIGTSKESWEKAAAAAVSATPSGRESAIDAQRIAMPDVYLGLRQRLTVSGVEARDL